jgi:hypothetical protein
MESVLVPMEPVEPRMASFFTVKLTFRLLYYRLSLAGPVCWAFGRLLSRTATWRS